MGSLVYDRGWDRLQWPWAPPCFNRLSYAKVLFLEAGISGVNPCWQICAGSICALSWAGSSLSTLCCFPVDSRMGLHSNMHLFIYLLCVVLVESKLGNL